MVKNSRTLTQGVKKNVLPVVASRFEKFEKSAAAAEENIEQTRERLRKEEMQGKSIRSERFEQARIWAAIWLLRLTVIVFGIVSIMVLVAGFTNFWPEIPGVVALRELFIQLVTSAKSIVLVVIGFFFRDYLKKNI